MNPPSLVEESLERVSGAPAICTLNHGMLQGLLPISLGCVCLEVVLKALGGWQETDSSLKKRSGVADSVAV
ncbi:hypothetical protein AAFF_G00160100 [Aldrovandia affinis]|uniref:Uncharacterized protein n=1 Tax=Aldrovandia affinis TaxID=143900 RepID=A0AAD7RN12_9TELE|nr:hypothetical protein AAFF_G00160100 [Aldrovandia affinis]